MATFGMYEVSVNSEQFYIYPEDKKGDTFKVSIERTCFHLKHKSNEVVTFKRYKHRGKWYWNDSRSKGPCGEKHVSSEVARMLFGGDTKKADNLLVSGMMGKME